MAQIALAQSVHRHGDSRVALGLGTALTGMTLFFGVAVLLNDALFVVASLLWVAVFALAFVPRAALMFAVALVMLFEGGSADKAMALGDFVNNGLTGSSGVTGFVATPLEVLLLLTLLSWLFRSVLRGSFGLRGVFLGWPMVIFTLALIAGFARGMIDGGDPYIGLFESRYLFYVPICFFLAASSIRTRGDVRVLTAVILGSTALFAVEGTYRKIALIDTGILGVIQEFSYQHEDAIFLGIALLLILIVFALGGPIELRVLGIVAFPAIAFTLLAAERRAGFIALFVGFIAIALVLLARDRRAFAFVIVPLVVAAAVYFPLNWHNPGMLGQPARAVRSISQPDARDAASNVARLLETINVGANIDAQPILGLGFGRAYEFVVPVPDLSWWPLWHYVAHNNVLWLWLKLGVAGFIAFFVLVGAALVHASQLARTLTLQETRTFAALAVAAILAILVFSYVDIALTSGRVTVFLGTLLGTLGALSRIETRELGRVTR